MKRLLVATCSLSLLLASPALADESYCAHASMAQPFIVLCPGDEFSTYWYAGSEMTPTDDDQLFRVESFEDPPVPPHLASQEQQEQAEVGDVPMVQK